MTTDTSPAIRIPMDPGVWAAMFRLASPVLRTPGLHRRPAPVPAAAPDDGPRCLYSVQVTSDLPGEPAILLVCDRIDPAHAHDENGIHWDETDNIAWKYGCPPGEQEARGA